MAKDMSKIEPITKKKGTAYEDAPEDLKGTGKMTDSQGICEYCGQSRFVKIFPGEDPDKVATRECECSEARQERELQNTIHATKKGMDKRLKNISDDLRESLKSWVEPIARNELDSIAVKLDASTIIKIVNKKDKPTCIVSKHDVLEIDEMDGVME
ncbi:MAG: hypothetical protein IJP84_01245 [Lachnospiraceae bacterium]|nr:hypothetical protein [Lachnospiraceae bacterium]